MVAACTVAARCENGGAIISRAPRRGCAEVESDRPEWPRSRLRPTDVTGAVPRRKERTSAVPAEHPFNATIVPQFARTAFRSSLTGN